MDVQRMASVSTVARPAKAATRAAWWRALVRWEQPAALVLIAAVFAAVQAGSPHIVGIDGQYHIKTAALIREEGPRIDFPWLRFTILNQAAYTDHHLLFHLLQAPFTVLDLRLAAKLSAIVFATLSFWGYYLFLAKSGVRWPLFWLAVLLAVAHTFLWRHSMARPQSLALLLIIGTVWLTFERSASRQCWLIPLGFASAWLFDGFILTLSIPAAWLAAGLMLDRRLDWRPLGYLALGTALGLVIHPYFPRNVVFAALHLLPKTSLSMDPTRVGSEWYPYSGWGFYSRVGPSLAVMVLGVLPVLARLWRRERPDARSMTLTLLAIMFLAVQVRSQRIIEYFPAFAVLLASWTWSFEPPTMPARVERAVRRLRPVVPLCFALLVGGWLVSTVMLARRDTLDNAGVPARLDSYRDAAAWLVENSPPGSLVFNTDWDDFPQLFYYNTHNVYVVGLDVTYMSLYDPELYHLWRSISAGSVAAPSVVMRDQFGAQYAFSDTRHAAFLSQAANDPGLEEAFRSSAAVVFKLRALPS
jgi:hypothetical protein